MAYKIWVYHSSDEPKQIEFSKYSDHIINGWYDTPLKCDGFSSREGIKEAIEQGIKGAVEGLGVTEEKARSILIHQIGEKTQYVADFMNDSINTKAATKKEIRELAKKIKQEFGEKVCVSQYSKAEGVRKLNEYYDELKNGESK